MNIPKSLRTMQDDLGAEVYLVGGAVRDLLRGRAPNDLDFVVRCDQHVGIFDTVLEHYLSARGELNLVGRSFGVYLFTEKGSDQTVEIAFPRTETSTGDGHGDFTIKTCALFTLDQDAARRDFTINAMYLPISAIKESGEADTSLVLDFHKGREHLVERLVVAVGDAEQRIVEDPLRMLRAAVLVARTGFRLEGRTFAALKKNAEKIQTVSAERVRDEFTKIMESQAPSRAFKMMRRTGLLKEVLPELDACYGCGQNPKYHSYPVFEHLLAAADAACQITERLDVRLGALFHDLGKAPTRALRAEAVQGLQQVEQDFAEGKISAEARDRLRGQHENDVTFYNHELVSTQMTFQLMCRMKFPRVFTEEVVRLVRQHQYKYDRTWTDKAVRRFIKGAGIVEADLEDLDNHPQFLVRQADRMGNAMKAHLPITQKQRDFQVRIKEIYLASSAHSPKDLKVNGTDLMEELQLPSGPLLGKTIQHLFDAVEGEPDFNTREKLLELAKSFVMENKDG